MKSRKKVVCVLVIVLAILIVGTGFVAYKKITEEADEIVVEETEKKSAYICEEEIKKAFSIYQKNPSPAQIAGSVETLKKELSINFEGSISRETVEQIVNILEQNKIKATFFIPAMDIVEDCKIGQIILGAGNELGNYTLNADSHSEKKKEEELIPEICRAQKIYEMQLNIKPQVIKFNATKMNQKVLRQAKACGFNNVISGENYLNYASFSSYKQASDYINRLQSGSVINIKLNGYLDEIEYERREEPETEPAEDREAGINMENLSEQERLIQVIQWLCRAISANDYQIVSTLALQKDAIEDKTDYFKELQKQNEGKKAKSIECAYTTDRKVSYLFRGISDEQKVDIVLQKLAKVRGSGTFFVTAEECEKYPDIIHKILDAGFEVENGGYKGKYLGEADYLDTCKEIYIGKQELEKFGIESTMYMPYSSDLSDAACEAVSALGMKLAGYDLNILKKNYMEEGYSAQKIMGASFDNSRLVLCRGDILYFNLDYAKSEIVEEVLQKIYNNKIVPCAYEGNRLQICTIKSLLSNTWYFPASVESVSNRIQESGMAQGNMETLYAQHFIGNPYLELTGFNEQELEIIDKEGRINTNGERVIFLTFDDWGNEESIGKILYVLKKHNVPATFFVKTQYISGSSRNLLRAMSKDGHDIASHTDTHMTVDITEETREFLKKDLVKSNQKLASVVGNTGHLTNYFRPPTLAVNAVGLSTIFDCGYSGIICGDYSTGDYKATSADEVYDVLVNGVVLNSGKRMEKQPGSILIMHMLPMTGGQTAEALDRYLTYMENLPDTDLNKYRIGRLSDYLGQ